MSLHEVRRYHRVSVFPFVSQSFCLGRNRVPWFIFEQTTKGKRVRRFYGSNDSRSQSSTPTIPHTPEVLPGLGRELLLSMVPSAFRDMKSRVTIDVKSVQRSRVKSKNLTTKGEFLILLEGNYIV